MPESEGLSRFAEAGVDFAVATAVLAVLAAAMTQALYDVGARSVLQKSWVRLWLSRKSSHLGAGNGWDNWRKAMKYRRLYSLQYQQLCGQVSSIIQTELDQPDQAPLLEIFADDKDLKELAFHAKELGDHFDSDSVKAKDFMNARQRVNAQVEDALDDLQVYLSDKFSRWTYTISFSISFFVIIILIVTPNQFVLGPNELPLYFAIWVAAGLLAPVIRNPIERILKAK